MASKMKNFDLSIEAILEKELYSTPPLMQVVVAKLVGSRQDIPRAFNLTKNEVSIADLKHLRRIKDQPGGETDCIICKLTINDGERIDDKLEEIKKRYAYDSIFRDFRVVLVPSKPPRTDHQWKACSTIWPCKFAKSNYLISCIDGSVFSVAERLVLNIIVNSLLEHIKLNSASCNSGAVVFRYAKVYGIGLSSLETIKFDPVKHSAMIAIDSVAKNAGSGHWKCHDANKKLYDSIQEKLDSKEELKDHQMDDTFLPYLCTNYDVFVTEEPCMVCTMGLVQSRIRRLFYLSAEHVDRLDECHKICYPDRAIEDFLIHRDKSLNHRFEAWRIKLIETS